MQFCYRCTDRSGADTCVKLLKPLQTSSRDFAGLKAHKLASVDGMSVFLECTDNNYAHTDLTCPMVLVTVFCACALGTSCNDFASS